MCQIICYFVCLSPKTCSKYYLKCYYHPNSSQHCIKRHLQPLMLLRLIIWDNKTYTNLGTDQEPSIYLLTG